MTALRVNESSGSIGSLQIADGYGGFLSGSLIAGSNITIHNDAEGNFTFDSQAAIAVNYLDSPSPNYLLATGSISFSPIGELTSDVGSDTFFFVSGSKGGKESGEGVAVFGGDLVVSGNLSIEGILSNVTLESVSSLNLLTNSVVEDSKEIRHQFAVNEYTGSFLSINEFGNLEKRNYKSPVFAQSSDPNSDLFFIVRYPGVEQKTAEKVFKDEYYLGPFDVIVSGNFQDGLTNKIAFVHDHEIFVNSTYINSSGDTENPSFNRQTVFVYDSVNNGVTETEVDESLTDNYHLGQKKRLFGNFLSDVNADFNISMFNLYNSNGFKEIAYNDLSHINVINKINEKNIGKDTTDIEITENTTGSVGRVFIQENSNFINVTESFTNHGYTNVLPVFSETLDSNNNFIVFPQYKFEIEIYRSGQKIPGSSNGRFDVSSSFPNNADNVLYRNDLYDNNGTYTYDNMYLLSSTNNPVLFNTSSIFYYPNQTTDLTREIFSDISSTEFKNFITGSNHEKYELGNYDLTLNPSVKTYGTVQNYASYTQWKQLFSYYLTNGRPDKVKLGTKISINRRDELYKRYNTTSKEDLLERIVPPYYPASNGIFTYNSKTNLPNLEPSAGFLGVLYARMCAMYLGIQKWNSNNPSSLINEFTSDNYPEFMWEEYGKIALSNSKPDIYPFFPYTRLRFFFITSIFYNYQKLQEMYESIIEEKPNFANITLPTTLPLITFKYRDTELSYKDITFSFKTPSREGTTSQINDSHIANKTLNNIFELTLNGTIGYYAGKFLNFYKIKDYFQDYEEYLYYLSVFNTDTPDVTQRDYINPDNQGKLAANSGGLIGDNDISKSQTEQRLNLRQKLILANKPALLVKGSSAFLGPVSIGQLEGQSPIIVNTTFQFGQSTPVIDENGNTVLAEDGTVLTTNTSLLSLNSKGFEGNLQVTGSIDITGFDRTDGMHINMGNLVMKTDLDGYNMPMFNMINNNSNPLERPQILLSNNLSSFASGEKAYHMGEITFGGPRNDSPSDDKENISISGVINENDGIGVNYLSMDFYINEERNLKGSDGQVPEDNKKRRVFVLGQFGDDNATNQFDVSTGMGIRGNILPLAVTDYSDLGNNIPAHHNTLGNDRYRWGGLFLDEDRQIEFGAPLSTHATIGYNSSNYSLEVSGRTRFLTGLTGSLTKLTDGTSYIRGIEGVTVTTGSKGEINIALTDYTSQDTNTSTTSKYSTTSLSGNSVIVDTGILEFGNYDNNIINIYNNGQLLFAGTYDEVLANEADYYIDPETNEITFSFQFDTDDILSIICHNDETDNRGQYRYDRIFSADQLAGTNVWFNFDFNSVNSDYSKFDVYYNGQYLERLTGVDDTLQPYTITAYNRLRFDFNIVKRDIITLVIKIPNPNTISDGSGVSEGDIQTKSKYVYNVDQSHAALSNVTISGITFDLDAYSKDVLTLYLNGQLLMSGTELDVSRKLADYVITGVDTLKFANNLSIDDVITFDLVLPGYDYYYNETVFLTANNSLLNNTLKLSGSNGIIAETINSNFVIKNNKELVFNEVLGGNANGENTYFTFANTPFSTSDISVFVNGQLQVPNDKTDYQDYSVTGSHLYFTTGSTPGNGSLVMAIYNKVTI